PAAKRFDWRHASFCPWPTAGRLKWCHKGRCRRLYVAAAWRTDGVRGRRTAKVSVRPANPKATVTPSQTPAPGKPCRGSSVDSDAGNELVERINPLVKRSFRPEVMGGLGGFGALFALSGKYREPVLVSGTDGV